MHDTDIYYPVVVEDGGEAKEVVYLWVNRKVPLLSPGVFLWLGGDLDYPVVASVWNVPSNTQTLWLEVGNTEKPWPGIASWCGLQAGFAVVPGSEMPELPQVDAYEELWAVVYGQMMSHATP